MPESIGFLFPGQGAQSVGMGRDLYDSFPTARKIFEEADAVLGNPISKICFEGPEETLTRTRFAQPAIFVTSLAALAVLKDKFSDLKPSLTAGLSLGEFTALVAAEALSFEDGLRLVQKRAEAMERSGEKFPGTMASILGLSKADCEAVSREAGCEVANLNAEDQIVLSGTFESIQRACPLAESKGAKRAIPLKVGGAFHSSLMREAKEDLEKALSQTVIRRPSAFFVPNVTGQSVSDPDEIRTLLAKQLMSPVRWHETMIFASQTGTKLFLEIGPGKVLKGLARKILQPAAVESCGTLADIEKLEKLFVGV